MTTEFVVIANYNLSKLSLGKIDPKATVSFFQNSKLVGTVPATQLSGTVSQKYSISSLSSGKYLLYTTLNVPSTKKKYTYPVQPFYIEHPVPVCGNGVLEAGEQCDDGNAEPGDKCSASCIVEPLLIRRGAYVPSMKVARELIVEGSRAYISGDDARFAIDKTDVVDISTPASPVKLATLPFNVIRVQGNRAYSYVYLRENDRKINLYDISNLATPVLLGSYPLPESASRYSKGQVAEGNYVYILHDRPRSDDGGGYQ